VLKGPVAVINPQKLFVFSASNYSVLIYFPVSIAREGNKHSAKIRLLFGLTRKLETIAPKVTPCPLSVLTYNCRLTLC